MTAFDVAIIGGGLAGCSAALHLRKRNASVVLLERNMCGGHASGVNYGGVRQQGRHLAELPLARRSRQIWAELPRLVGCDGEFSATGHLKLARSDAEFAELEAYAASARDYGLDLELIGPDEISRRFPYLGEVVVGGSFCSEDGSANPRLVAPAFARAAQKAGADLREGVKVVDAGHDGKTFALRTSQSEALYAHRLINTAGAWGSVFSAQFGEPVPEDVMAPNMCVTDPLPYFLTPNLGTCGGEIYLRQIPRGNVIFGSGLGFADLDQGRARPSLAATQKAAVLAVKLVPRLVEAQLIRTWSGVEGVMPDGLPVLSPSAVVPGLIHAFGFSGHGFQLGPAVGAIVSELALDGETPTPIEPFHIARFSGKKHLHNGSARANKTSEAQSPEARLLLLQQEPKKKAIS